MWRLGLKALRKSSHPCSTKSSRAVKWSNRNPLFPIAVAFHPESVWLALLRTFELLSDLDGRQTVFSLILALAGSVSD